MKGKSVIIYNDLELTKYLKDLQLLGSLSSLFSDNSIPFIHYRVAENLYCSNFNADNLSRADVAVDAKYKVHGVGVKTFCEENKKTMQKIAEFNKQTELYKNLEPLEKIKKISELRNNRIIFTKNNYSITDFIYHCVIRNKQGIFLFEENMCLVDMSNIKLLIEKKTKEHIYLFTDGVHEYQFNESKSTLYKRFITTNYFAEIEVTILDEPMEDLRKMKLIGTPAKIVERLVLPLFSVTRMQKIVPPKSGLNQWNAGGRKRDLNEVYIPFPIEVRNAYDSFFPARDTSFDVKLPNGDTLSMKVCQDGGKAIMSNPNKALGEWILRKVLKLPEGTLLTYEMLLSIGIDSVVFEKIEGNYSVDFGDLGTFEEFMYEHIIPDYE